MADPEPLLQEPAPAAPPDEAARRRRSALVIVFLVVFIDLLGFGIVLPVLPIIADVYLEQIVPGGKDAPLTGAARTVGGRAGKFPPSCNAYSLTPPGGPLMLNE